jgi:hypothetical protein
MNLYIVEILFFGLEFLIFITNYNRPERNADPSPLLVPRSKNRVAIPLLSLKVFMACIKDKPYLLQIMLFKTLK